LGGSEKSGVFLTQIEEPLAQKAAIRLIPAEGADADARIQAWEAASALSHPHLMPVLFTGRCQIGAAPMIYVVTEFAEEVLAHFLPERPLVPAEAKELLAALVDALSYLHQKGFVYGHIKPTNIMAVADQLKLSSDHLPTSCLSGKHPAELSIYDAPETATGKVTPAGDIWALGVTLVEILTQHTPVWDRSKPSEPVVPASIPQPFADLARECLHPDPQQRCTLSQIRIRLNSTPEATAATVIAPPSKTSSKRPMVIFASVVFPFVLLALGAAYLYPDLYRSHSPQPSLAAQAQQPASPSPEAPAPVTQAPSATQASQAPNRETSQAPSQSPASGQPPVAKENTVAGGATSKGSVLHRVLPDIPQKANESIHGSFHLGIRVKVNPSGVVTEATLDDPGPSRYFANLCLDAARQWSFQPPVVQAQTVSSEWVLTFAFARDKAEVTPVQAAP
jgi:TonB family protein